MSASPFLVFMISFYLDKFTVTYRMFEWPNRLMHFLGGFSITITVYLLLQFFKANKWIVTVSKYFDYLLVIVSALSIAAFWEFYEFFVDKYFPGPYLAQPSVSDTMKDMIMGLCGTLMFVLIWHIRNCFKKPEQVKSKKKRS